jgi:hypothetical protein
MISRPCGSIYPTTKQPRYSASATRIVESDRYPFSPRIRTLPAIRAKLSPEPAREPLPRPKHDEPPRSSSRRWR